MGKNGNNNASNNNGNIKAIGSNLTIQNTGTLNKKPNNLTSLKANLGVGVPVENDPNMTVNVSKSNLEALKKNHDLKFFKSEKNEKNKPTLAISANKSLPLKLANHYNKNNTSINKLFPNNNTNKKYRVNPRIFEMAKNGKLTKKNSTHVNLDAARGNLKNLEKNLGVPVINDPNNNKIIAVGGKVMYGGRKYAVRYGARGGRYILRGGRKMYF